MATSMPALAAQPGNQSFQRTWQRTDQPVLDGLIARTWMWGPEANTTLLQEPYAEAPEGMRVVQYYDKSRMEITDPAADAGSVWYVTNGLLVVELITGRMQTGDATFEERELAMLNVAGDADDPSGPTYATFGNLLGATPRAAGATITQRVGRTGALTTDPALASQGVTVALVDEVTNHAIAAPFWAFMTSSGSVYDSGQTINDQLFENPYFATGRPITEAYWANVKVGGQYRDVLMQCFERRCLTYTPGNPAGFEVEAGNVGQHYYAWRYADETPEPTPDPTPEPAPEPATRYDFLTTFGSRAKGIELKEPTLVAVAPSGDVYVTNSAMHQVLKFAPNGEFITAWGSLGSSNGQFYVPMGIDVDESGNVYVADYANHRIQKFDENGAFITAWGSEGSEQGQFKFPYDLAIGTDNMLYVTDLSNNRVQRFELNGSFGGMWGSEGSGPGQFKLPQGIAAGSNGLIYVADTGNNRVQIFDGAGNPQGGFGQLGDSDGQFNTALGLTVANDGTVYVSDIGQDRVQVFTIEPVLAPAESRSLAAVYYSYAGTLGDPGLFNDPIGLDIDGNGRILVVDSGNKSVRIFAKSGFGLQGKTTLVDTWIDATRSRFVAIRNMALGKDGRVYVVDIGEDIENAKVQVFGPDGAYLDQWRGIFVGDIAADSEGNLFIINNTTGRIEKVDPDGNLIEGWGPVNSGRVIATRAALAVDAQDNLYVLHAALGSIQKYTSDGVFLDAWGAPGSQPGQLSGATGIAIHGERVYVADLGNHRVQVFDLNGTYITEWGGLGTGDGQFNEPHGIAVDADGYVYVTDSENDRIQKFTPDGEFLAKWGGPGTGDGLFGGPEDIAVSAAGDVYVADTGNFRIQVFQPVS